MKKDKTIYWITTALVCAVMAFSAINFNLSRPFGPFERPFEHLGLPDYLRVELSIAKALGVVALLVPRIPRWLKGFAYSGFAITLVSASIAHFSTGDRLMFAIDPLFFLAVLAVSYWYFIKLDDARISAPAASTPARNRADAPVAEVPIVASRGSV